MKKVGDGVPGCTIPPSGPTPKEGYCYKPNKGSRVARLSGKKKLKWCEGHCLNDDHCSVRIWKYIVILFLLHGHDVFLT